MGGFFSDFEAIQTVILRIIVETIVNLHAIEKTQSRGDVASMEWDDVVSMAWDVRERVDGVGRRRVDGVGRLKFDFNTGRAL